MQVPKVINNSNNSPKFRGKIILIDNKLPLRFNRIKEIQISQDADEILYDAFIKATGMNYYGVGFGLRHRDSKYLEYVKKLKEISGINTEEIMRYDNEKMYGYSRTNDQDLNERSYQINLNGRKRMIIEHVLNFIPKTK